MEEEPTKERLTAAKPRECVWYLRYKREGKCFKMEGVINWLKAEGEWKED